MCFEMILDYLLGKEKPGDKLRQIYRQIFTIQILVVLHLFLALSSGAYERFCVLFNIGALLSQLAAQKGLHEDDDLKVAAKYFQQAAGIYSHLKDNVYPVLQTLPTPDLAVSSLVALNSIMLAQAQDCIYKKASSG